MWLRASASRFVAAVKASGRISLYVNGALEGRNSLGTFVDTNSVPLRIGASDMDVWWLYGEVAQVQMFRSVLSAPLVLALIEQSKVKYGY